MTSMGDFTEPAETSHSASSGDTPPAGIPGPPSKGVDIPFALAVPSAADSVSVPIFTRKTLFFWETIE